MAAGTRFAIYRDVGVGGLPMVSIGEGIVISAAHNTALTRITPCARRDLRRRLRRDREGSAQPTFRSVCVTGNSAAGRGLRMTLKRRK